MKVDQIVDSLGQAHPPQPISHTGETFNETTMVYHEIYAASLSSFFETNWFHLTENGQLTFPRDANLIELMASFLKTLENVSVTDHTRMTQCAVLESRIVWQLARMACSQVQGRTNSTMMAVLPPEGDRTEAGNRVAVLDALLSGESLAINPLAPPASDPDPHRARQFSFWYSLAEFLRKRDYTNAKASTDAREACLSRLRRLVDGRENRDLLYSIAVVRELKPNFEPNYEYSLPQHLDETDPKSRLAVATKFILDESQVSGGSTNVLRRVSDIAVRAFVNPGVNVARGRGNG